MNIKYFLITIFFLSFGMWGQSYSQSVTCNSMVLASVNGVGEITLTPGIFIEGSVSDFDSLWLDTYQLDCTDLGLNTITVYAIDQSGTQSSCQCILTLQDKLKPIVMMKNATVTLDANGEHIIEKADVDNGSTDNCSDLFFSFSPSVISCGMPNPTLVTMTVTDISGASGTAASNVYYQDADGGTIACNADIPINIPNNTSYLVEYDEVLANYTGDCPSAVYLTMTVDGVNRANNTLTNADAGKNIVAKCTAGNNACWANIIVTNSSCPFTLQENQVIWPASATIDIDVDYCDINITNYSPQSLIQNFDIDPSDVLVSFQPLESCLYPTYTYTDFVTNETNLRKIKRTYTALEWVNNTSYTFTQTINIHTISPFVCDTLPWNTPLGDCASGHTDMDIVEWPADITINTPKFLPDQLANNPEVNPNDARPTLTAEFCGLVTIKSQDELTLIGNGQMLITRTWIITSVSGIFQIYVQKINVNYSNQNVFCAFRNNGDAIPGVEMASGFITDDSGCVDMTNYTGDLVNPFKDSPAQDGVDINDLIAIYDYILGVNYLDNFYVKYAADINGNNVVSTLDKFFVEKIMNGTYQPDPVWTFFDLASPTHKTTINISENNPFNTFIGVKSGDVNDSYDLGNFSNPNPEDADLLLINQVLNNGQVYSTPIYNPISEKFTAINLSFEKVPGLKLKNVFAPFLPNFVFEDNVIEDDKTISINYIVPQDFFSQGGVFINQDQPLFILSLVAEENGILSEKLVLAADSKNLIQTERFEEAVSIKLNWDEVIINKINSIPAVEKLVVTPNPANDFIYLNNGSNTDLPYAIYTTEGRLVKEGTTNGSMIEINELNIGMYLIQVNTHGIIQTNKFFKF